MGQSTGLVFDPAFALHDTGAGHPESPQRLDALIQGLERAGLRQRCTPIAARPASDAELLRCHSRRYLQTVQREIAYGRDQLSTGDTPLCDHSEEVARLAAGGVLAAVEAVLAGQLANAFAAVRPPGHHAEPERGMGFCLFNNVAIAARHAQAAFGVGRVLIVDWDVHHGNGTQAIFWDDPSVLYFSVHQWPLYPGTGAASQRGGGAGEGFTINCPLPPGSGRAAVLAALREQLLPAAEAFRPELVLVSAGFDGALGDPLGDFLLLDVDFAELTRLVRGIAERHAGGRLVSVLEGGYDLAGLARSAAAHVAALLEGPAERPEPLAPAA